MIYRSLDAQVRAAQGCASAVREHPDVLADVLLVRRQVLAQDLCHGRGVVDEGGVSQQPVLLVPASSLIRGDPGGVEHEMGVPLATMISR